MTDVKHEVGTLLEALPYIREFHGKTVVIKYGGAAMTEPELREDFARDVLLLKYVGLNPIIVHGGGPDITAYMNRLDMPVEFVGGLRVSVQPGGCSGFKYGLLIEDQPADDDFVVQQVGFKLFVDPFSAQYLNNVVIDYVSSMQGSGFTFKNPNATGSCGCGTSFTA